MNPSAIEVADLVLFVAGCALWLWAIIGGGARRWLDTPNLLPAWPVGTLEFIIFLFVALVGYVVAPFAAVTIAGFDPKAAPTARTMLVPGFAAQFALLAACVWYRSNPARRPAEALTSIPRALATGAGAILFALPLLTALITAWEWLLERCGVRAPPQEVLAFFRNASGPGELALWIILAVVVAPLTEELFFRAGIYRFLAARLRPWAASLLSAVVFALPHENLRSTIPLIALGVVLSLVYEKTGRVIAPIVLHGIFNLHTVLIALYGPPL